MVERRPSLSSWFRSSASRRKPAAQIAAPPPPTTTSAPTSPPITVETQTKKANEETTKEGNDFLSPKLVSESQIIEKPEFLCTPDWMLVEKTDALNEREKFPTSRINVKLITNARTSPPHGKSMILDTPLMSVTDDTSTSINPTAIADPKSVLYERSASVITLAGENRGVSMQMGTHYSKREVPLYIHRRYKLNPDKSAESTNNEKASPKGNKLGDANDAENQPTEEYINNNLQGINNSIVFNCSVTQRDPGIHMITSTHVQPVEPIEETSPTETRKVEFNMAPADKRAYELTVIRRRCLRGLLLESSDSDAENHKRPRRHGCRVGCKETGRASNLDVI